MDNWTEWWMMNDHRLKMKLVETKTSEELAKVFEEVCKEAYEEGRDYQAQLDLEQHKIDENENE